MLAREQAFRDKNSTLGTSWGQYVVMAQSLLRLRLLLMQSVAKNHRVQLQLLSLKPEQTITITMNDAVLPNAITCFQSNGLKYNPPSLHSPAPCEAETRRLPVPCGVSAKQMLKNKPKHSIGTKPNDAKHHQRNASRNVHPICTRCRRRNRHTCAGDDFGAEMVCEEASDC